MRFLSCCLCALLTVSQVAARSEYHLGADGNPWQDTLLEDGPAGVYLVFDKDGQQVRRVSVGITPYGAGTDTLIDFSGTTIQPRFIDPAVNLANADPETDLGSGSSIIPLPYIGGGANGGQNQNYNVFKMLDGDLTSAQFRRFVQDPNSQPGIGEGWACGCSFDFGADVPVNRIRFYPRLDKEEDLRLIERFSDPQMPVERFGQFSFVEFFLERGAATNLPEDEDWATPLAWAQKRGHNEIAAVLRQAGALK